MKPKYFHTLLAALFLTLTGCKKDNNPEPNQPTQSLCYLSQLKTQLPGSTDWVMSSEVIMDANNRIARGNTYSIFEPGQITRYTNFEYNASGHLIKAEEFRWNGTPTRYFTFQNNAQGKIIRQDDYEYHEFTGLFNHTNHWLMEYNASNQLVKHINYQEGLNNYGTFEYSAAGNVVRTLSYHRQDPNQPFVQGGSTEYEYDDKKAFHTGFSTLKFNAFSLSPNNITVIRSKDSNGDIRPDQSETYIYNYNNQGYPVEFKVSTFANPGTFAYAQMNYICD